MSDGVFSGRL